VSPDFGQEEAEDGETQGVRRMVISKVRVRRFWAGESNARMFRTEIGEVLDGY
jgi:hypothetical protein